MPLKNKQIKKIAIVKGSSIGDSILAIPLIRNVKKNFPKAVVYLIVGESTSGFSILKTCPYIDKIIQVKRYGLLNKLGSILELLKLKAEKIDLLVLGNPTTIAIKKFAHYIKPKKILENKNFDISRPIIEMDLEILEKIGLKTDDGHLELFYNIVDKKKDKNLICVYLGRDADEHRLWPIERWSALIKKIIDKYGFDIALLGADDNKINSNDLICLLGEKYSAKIKSFVGKLSLDGTAAKLIKCRFLITTNGGPMHLANALSTPLIALHGPSPDMWMPRGKFVINIKADKTKLAGKDPNVLYKGKSVLMGKISVDQVFNKVNLLAKLTG